MIRRLFPGQIQRFCRDEGGVAAIEFAFIAPIMMVLYFGLVEFCQGYMASRRAGHTASIVADLVAQSDETSPDDVESIFAIGDMIMQPFPSSQLSIRVSSVTMNDKGVAKVDWSQANDNNMAPRDKDEVVGDLPPDLIQANESLILGETEFKYTSAFGQVIKKPITFTRSYYLRPRTVDKVACTDC